MGSENETEEQRQQRARRQRLEAELSRFMSFAEGQGYSVNFSCYAECPDRWFFHDPITAEMWLAWRVATCCR